MGHYSCYDLHIELNVLLFHFPLPFILIGDYSSFTCLEHTAVAHILTDTTHQMLLSEELFLVNYCT